MDVRVASDASRGILDDSRAILASRKAGGMKFRVAVEFAFVMALLLFAVFGVTGCVDYLSGTGVPHGANHESE